MKLEPYWQIFEKKKTIEMLIFTKIRAVGAELFHADGRSDRRARRSNFANAPRYHNFSTEIQSGTLFFFHRQALNAFFFIFVKSEVLSAVLLMIWIFCDVTAFRVIICRRFEGWFSPSAFRVKYPVLGPLEAEDKGIKTLPDAGKYLSVKHVVNIRVDSNVQVSSVK